MLILKKYSSLITSLTCFLLRRKIFLFHQDPFTIVIYNCFKCNFSEISEIEYSSYSPNFQIYRISSFPNLRCNSRRTKKLENSIRDYRGSRSRSRRSRRKTRTKLTRQFPTNVRGSFEYSLFQSADEPTLGTREFNCLEINRRFHASSSASDSLFIVASLASHSSSLYISLWIVFVYLHGDWNILLKDF